MQAMLLGTAGWVPTDSRDTACVYLRQGDRVLLLDAGTGARHLLDLPSLIRGVTRIDVCLSHFHLDHLIGLSYLPGLPSEIELVVWGPGKALYEISTADLLGRLIGPPFFALEMGDFAAAVEDLPLGQIEVGTFAMTARTQHRHTQPSVAFRVGNRLAYCTDTGYDPANAPFAAGCSHLLHEAFYLERKPDDTHSTPSEAARIARDADVSLLTLVHIDPRIPDEAHLLEPAAVVFPETRVGRDLMTLE